MTLRRPSRADLAAIIASHLIKLTEVEADDFYELVCEYMGIYDELAQYPDPAREVLPAIRIRTVVFRRLKIHTVQSCALARTSCPSPRANFPVRLSAQRTPSAWPTYRFLALHYQRFAFSGRGHTSTYGASLNPKNSKHAAEGLSCGSAAAVDTNMADLALDGDQGGSIHSPSTWSGIAGPKHWRHKCSCDQCTFEKFANICPELANATKSDRLGFFNVDKGIICPTY